MVQHNSSFSFNLVTVFQGYSSAQIHLLNVYKYSRDFPGLEYVSSMPKSILGVFQGPNMSAYYVRVF